MSGRTQLVNLIFEPPELLTILFVQSNRRLDSVLPSAIQKQTFLRREAQVSFFPLPVLQNAEFLEQLPNKDGFSAWDWNVMGGPWISRDLVFAPARIAAGLIVHLEQNEIVETLLVQAPRSTEAGNAATHNDNRHFQGFLWSRKARAIAQQVALLKRIIYKRSCDGPLTLERKPYQRGAGRLQEFPPRDPQ